MKVIDERGKIFGKLNIIDLIVLLLVIAVAALLGMKMLGGGNSLGGDTTKLTYTVKVYHVEKSVYDSIQDKIPGQLMASGKMLDGYVTKVEAQPSESQIYRVSNRAQGVVDFLVNEEEYYDLTFTIEANVKNATTNEIGTQEVRIGKGHIVKTTQFELEGGVILNCVTEPQT